MKHLTSTLVIISLLLLVVSNCFSAPPPPPALRDVTISSEWYEEYEEQDPPYAYGTLYFYRNTTVETTRNLTYSTNWNYEVEDESPYMTHYTSLLWSTSEYMLTYPDQLEYSEISTGFGTGTHHHLWLHLLME